MLSCLIQWRECDVSLAAGMPACVLLTIVLYSWRLCCTSVLYRPRVCCTAGMRACVLLTTAGMEYRMHMRIHLLALLERWNWWLGCLHVLCCAQPARVVAYDSWQLGYGMSMGLHLLALLERRNWWRVCLRVLSCAQPARAGDAMLQTIYTDRHSVSCLATQTIMCI